MPSRQPQAGGHSPNPCALRLGDTPAMAYAYELPGDPEHPDDVPSSTLIRDEPMHVGERLIVRTEQRSDEPRPTLRPGLVRGSKFVQGPETECEVVAIEPTHK